MLTDFLLVWIFKDWEVFLYKGYSILGSKRLGEIFWAYFVIIHRMEIYICILYTYKHRETNVF